MILRNEVPYIFHGFNVSFAAFGRAGTDKSQTLFGGVTSKDNPIVFDVVTVLLDMLSKHQADSLTLGLRCFETYGNEIFDLQDSKRVKHISVSQVYSQSLRVPITSPFIIPSGKHVTTQSTLPESTTAFSCLNSLSILYIH